MATAVQIYIFIKPYMDQRHLLVILWLLFASGVAAQRPFVQVISEERQFGQSSISKLLEDHQGIIWAGSYLGLVRFDGLETTIYRPEMGNLNSISSEFVYDIYEDSRHYLWIATRNGLNCLDPSRRFFTRFMSETDNPETIPNNRVFSLLPDSDTTFYLFCDNSELTRFNTVTRKATRLRPEIVGADPQMPPENAFALRGLITANGITIIGTRMAYFDYRLEENKYYPMKDPWTGYEDLNRRGFLNVDREGVMWFYGQEERLYAWVPGVSLTSWYLPELQHMASLGSVLIKDFDHQHLLLSVNQSYWLFNRISGNLSPLMFRSDQQHLLHPHTSPELLISDCLLTRDSIVVLGTVKGDLMMINPGTQHFGFTQVLPWDPQMPDQIQNAIGDIFDDSLFQNRYITVLRDSFFYIENLRTGEITRHRKPAASSVESKWFQDSQDRLWLCSDREVFHVDRRNQSLQSWKPDSPARSLFVMVELDPGEFIVGSFNEGLYRFVPGSKVFERIPEARGWKRTQVFSMKADRRQGCVWIGTVRNGLFRYDIERDTFYHYVHDTRNPYALAGDWVRDITIDSSGYVWFATDPVGLCRFDYHAHPDSAFITITREHGLPSSFVAGLGTDPKGFLWMTTLDGMARIDPHDMSVIHFSKTDGLPSRRFNRANLVMKPSGHVMVGTQTGYLHFNTSSLPHNPQPPGLIIRDLLVFDTSRMTLDAEGRVEPLQLRYKENFLTILFSIINYTEPHLNSVRYIMEGLEENWNTRAGITRVAYTNIPPGKYTFRIMAANNDGVWNENETILEIEVRPPFWQRTWFYLLLAGVAAGLITTFYRYKLAQSVERNRLMAEKETLKAETEKQLAQLEMKALQAQMNPHFIFNCLNAINRFIIINDNDTASEYLTKFSKLIRQVLDSSRGEQIPLSTEIRTLGLYLELESLRFADKFGFTIALDTELDIDAYMIQPMLIQPYVENAILHGLMYRKSKGKLLLKFTRKGESLQVVIEDNGVGRAKSKQIQEGQAVKRRSHGMKVTAERMSLLSRKLNVQVMAEIEDLYDAEGSATGTRVIVTLPLEKRPGESEHRKSSSV